MAEKYKSNKKKCAVCTNEDAGPEGTYEHVEHCRRCGHPVCGFCKPVCCDLDDPTQEIS